MNAETLEQLKALNYPMRIVFDEEDKLFTAEFIDLPGCSAVGETVEEAFSHAQLAKEDWLKVALEQGLPIPKPTASDEYSGRILLRLPGSLHGMLSDGAKIHGASLNQYLVHLLSSAAVGDQVSAKLEELRDCINKMEWRIANLNENVGNLAAHTAQSTFPATTAVPYQRHVRLLQVFQEAGQHLPLIQENQEGAGAILSIAGGLQQLSTTKHRLTVRTK
jgi:predicted RNase H-like HicB family nuclease